MADSFFGGLFGTNDKEKEKDVEIATMDDAEIDNVEVADMDAVDVREVEDGKLELRQEKLDVNKDRVQTGEVSLRKEIIEEEQVINVPVSHEEVVIERRAIAGEPSDAPISAEESIRIPVSKEQVHVSKHTVLTGEVEAHKRSIEETEQVKDTVKREEARVDVTGDPILVDNDASSTPTLH